MMERAKSKITGQDDGACPSSARQLPRHDYLAIKAATRRLIETAGGQNAAAAATRVGHTSLSRYGHPDAPADFAPVDVIADLEAECGVPIVTRELASLAGFALTPVSAKQLDSHTAIAGIARESGELLGALAEALRDQHISPVEAAMLTEKLDSLEALVASMKAQVRKALPGKSR